MKKIYILKMGETFFNTKKYYGDFDDWIQTNTAKYRHEIETIDVLNNEALPKFDDTLGVIITGSHSMVTDNCAWSVQTEQWIKHAVEKQIPILGICYGHQLLCKALGGVVENNPNGKEIGTVQVFSNNPSKKDLLFNSMPKSFYAHVTHMQSAITLPKGAVVLASNTHDAHQIVRYDSLVWGVQFHPEFDCAVMKSYIKEQEKELSSYGFDINKLQYSVAKTKYSNELLEKFVQLVHQQEFSLAS